MNWHAAYILKMWLTSGILTPCIFVLLLSIFPGFHVPDMIGIICMIYIFPGTLMFSIVNAVFLAVALFIAYERIANIKFMKLTLSLTSLIITFLSTLLIHKLQIFDINDDFLLPTSYLISMVAAIWFYRLEPRVLYGIRMGLREVKAIQEGKARSYTISDLFNDEIK